MASSPSNSNQPPEKFHLVAHEVFLRLKNKQGTEKQQEEILKPPKLFKYYFGFLQILADWVIDLFIAGFHFYEGRYLVGGLTLGFVFLGGFFVTLNLHVLMRRKGDKEFKAELRKISPILLCLIYIPSLLPLFSGGLQIKFAHKLIKAHKKRDKTEIQKLERLQKICEEHSVTDVLYESCYEAYGQAILQMMSMLEKPEYTSIKDYIPLIGVFFAWLEVTMPPIQLAESLGNLKVKWPEMIAGLGNKGVTLLTFTLFIAAARQQFSDPSIVQSSQFDTSTPKPLEGDTTWLIVSTVGSILFLGLFSEIPGIVAFRLELRSKIDLKVVKWIKLWELIINLISLVIPVGAFVFWTMTMHNEDQLESCMFYVMAGSFGLLFFVAVMGFFAHKNLPWLGQFSTDILLLLYIGIYSRLKQLEFKQIDFHYESHYAKDKEETNNNI